MDTKTRLRNLKEVYPNLVVEPLPTDSEEVCVQLLQVARLRILPELKNLNRLGDALCRVFSFSSLGKDIPSIVLEFYETSDPLVVLKFAPEPTPQQRIIVDMLKSESNPLSSLCPSPCPPKPQSYESVFHRLGNVAKQESTRQESAKQECSKQECCKQESAQSQPPGEINFSDFHRKISALAKSLGGPSESEILNCLVEMLKK